VPLLSSLLLGIGLVNPQGDIARQDSSPPNIIFVQAPIIAAGGLTRRFPRGSRIVGLRRQSWSGSPVDITPEFFAAAGPRMSFDGNRVLFAGQKFEGGLWQVWEMNADGSDKRQITSCMENCLQAAYLPGDEVAYTAVDSKDGEASYLAVCNRTGSEAHRITFGLGSFSLETVLYDGRLVASAASPLAGGSVSRMLYTLQSDGTALTAFRSAAAKVGLASDAEELDNGSVVFVRTLGQSESVAGTLSEIVRGVTHEVPLVAPEPLVWSPRRLAGGQLVVARWTGGASGSPGRFDLYSFDLATRTFAEKIYGDPELSSVQALAVFPPPKPRRLWSTLSSGTSAGYFICLNSRLSADGPAGTIPAATRVRVLTLQSGDQELPLGEAPVESDGSFFVAVPADQPVRFELLDTQGRRVKAQASWIWARPGEQRGCAGCHDDRARAPENRWPLALKRFDTPTPLGVKVSMPVAP